MTTFASYTKVYSILKPANGGSFPVFEDTDGYGGLQIRTDLADLNSVPSANKKPGMIAYVLSESKFYQLKQDKSGWDPMTLVQGATASDAGSIKLSGELGGTYDLPTVTKLIGKEIDKTTQTLNSSADGYVLTYNDATSKWLPKKLPAGSVPLATTSASGTITLAGDLGGTSISPVVKVAGKDVDTTVTLDSTNNDGYVLTWNASSTNWKPKSVPTATSSTAGLITLAGDLGGTSTSPVVKVAGKSVDTTVTLDASSNDGYVLAWNASSTKWKPAPIKILGKDITSSSLQSNYVLVYDNTSSAWIPTQINQDMIAAGFSVSLSYGGSTTLEYGTSVTNPSFTIGYNYLPTSLSFSDNGGTPGSITGFTGNSYSKTATAVQKTASEGGPASQSASYFASGTYGGNTKSSNTVSITWTYKVFYGAGDDWSTYSTAAQQATFVTGLTSRLSSSGLIGAFSAATGSSQYAYFALPSAYTQISNFLLDGVTSLTGNKVGTDILISVGSVNIKYNVYQIGSAGIGTVSITPSS